MYNMLEYWTIGNINVRWAHEDIKLRSVEQKQKSTFVHNKQQLYIQFNCQYINMETTTYNLS